MGTNGAADANPRRVSRSLLLLRVRVGAAERQAIGRHVAKATNCPKCGGAMQRGRVAVQDTPLGCLFVGVSWMRLFFRADDTGDSHSILKPGETREAFTCRKCSNVLITGLPWHE